MTLSKPCRCAACRPSLPPGPAATLAEHAAHAIYLRRLAAVGALPDPTFHPYPTSSCPPRSSFPTTCATPA
ncbi:hypothetical protein [Hymenobacter cheonanensis]|uniref:hypothetical protein n=1 Tax=Hymenobacter sp. CA2-7 TaxID=3063993 RepID=UPI002713BA95|nr:hypothetical protein [Hymenobacter sp. CA2-7]MDO7886000.1 hypothetical protein [Hymenobacter sp. CA2-7]